MSAPIPETPRVFATLDYRPFGAPAPWSEVNRYRQWMPSRSIGDISGKQIIGWVVGGILAFALFPVAVSVIVGFLSVLFGGSLPFNGAIATVLTLVLFTVVAGGILALAIAARRRTWRERYRMDLFARANGLAAEPFAAVPHYQGAIFGVGRDRASYDRYRTVSGRFIDVGNYRYTTGSGKNSTVHHWGFLAMELDRRLPQMVLDSRANNGLLGATNLPLAFSRDQVLHLEGDFDRYFTLYCPRQYERDALYVFTPDLMALLIDEASPYDVEIVDNWLFVYSSATFAMTDPATLSRLFGIVDTVGAKLLRQSGRYADERVTPVGPVGPGAAGVPGVPGAAGVPGVPGVATPASAGWSLAAGEPGWRSTLGEVAPQGRRLKRGVSWASIAVAAIFFGGWLLVQIVSHLH